MFRYSCCSWFLTSAASAGCRSSWDPTVSLTLRHPTLFLLEKCRTREHYKQILAQMMRTHLTTETFTMSRLIVFSAITFPQNLDLAILLFNHYTPQPNLFIYNTMMSALSFSSQSINLYKSMLRSCIYPDEHTILSLLKASRCLSEGKQIHSHAIIRGFLSHAYLQNSLIKLYFDNGEMDLARQIYEQMPERDSFSCNIMIVGYAREGYSLEALELFQKMMLSGFEPDDFTVVGLLMSCGRLRDAHKGKSVHAWIERRKLAGAQNLILGNALLDMYAKCEESILAQRVFDGIEKKDVISWNTVIAGFTKVGDLETACRVFDEMQMRDLVSWNSLIAGYAQKGDFRAAMELFKDMLSEKVRPDKATVVGLICAATEIGSDQGRLIHGWTIKAHMKVDAFLSSALIDMYCKCGSIERALMVFDKVSERDVMVWTAMIAGLSFHGYAIKALKLFHDMHKDLMPNGVTFVAILTACNHGGMVDEGLRIFNSMKEKYGIEPRVEHYGCLIDLLGRAGRLIEANNVIDNMPVSPSASVWGAMLSACKTHGNPELGEIALKELLKLESVEDGGYVLLSNIYAASGRWSYSDKIREVMEIRGVKKTAGCSNVVVSGVVYEFVAADKTNPRWVEIYSVINCLNTVMRSGADNFF